MKKFSAIIAMLLCLCFCLCLGACNHAKFPPSSGSGNDMPMASPRIYPFDFDSYRDLKKSINKENKLYAELLDQGASDDTLGQFKAFVEKYQSQGMPVPHLNGKTAELRNKEGYSNISIYPVESYDFPCIFFHPYVTTGVNFYIRLLYLPDDVIEAQENPTASDIINALSPKPANTDNQEIRKESVYSQIYEQNIQLGDREVVALVREYKADSRNGILFLYDGWLVEVRCDPEIWTEQWFSTLTFEAYNR